MSHGLPEEKVGAFGVEAKMNYWITKQMKDRTFRVGVDGRLSDRGFLHSGVPRRSAFLVYVSDKAGLLESPRHMFAHNIKLLGTANSGTI